MHVFGARHAEDERALREACALAWPCLQDMLSDANPMVVANALAALQEVRLQLLHVAQSRCSLQLGTYCICEVKRGMALIPIRVCQRLYPGRFALKVCMGQKLERSARMIAHKCVLDHHCYQALLIRCV